MKPKRVKSPNQHLLAVRLPLALVKRVNAARINQGLEWAQLMGHLFERYLCDHELEKELRKNVERGEFSKLTWSGSGAKK